MAPFNTGESMERATRETLGAHWPMFMLQGVVMIVVPTVYARRDRTGAADPPWLSPYRSRSPLAGWLPTGIVSDPAFDTIDSSGLDSRRVRPRGA